MRDKTNLPTMLVVDDEPAILESFVAIFEGRFNVLTARSGKEALSRIARESINVVFLDIALPGEDGLQVLRSIRQLDGNVAVIMATAFDSARKAVQALQWGACNYITKPFDAQELISIADKAVQQELLAREIVSLRGLREQCQFENIIGKSKKIRAIFSVIEKVVANEATVLISGESGTGKELVARAIHYNSLRKHKPFVPINCAGIPASLLESELFGHERGAFTDASCLKLGMFELAHEGTLFLDEISGLKHEVQANLLRALEEREIRRLGGSKIIKIDVRIIAATNIDLRQAVEAGEFRHDLFYRLNVIPVFVPPLRERKEDIPLLTAHFVHKYNQVFRKNVEGFSADAMRYLMDYDWPGNIRELKNVIERMIALKDEGVIVPQDLPFDMFVKGSVDKRINPEGALREASRDFEKQYIEAVLGRVDGNQVKAAKILGIHRNALFNKMKSYGLKKINYR
jgi:two-component system, NtrC family, response regulator AtoC